MGKLMEYRFLLPLGERSTIREDTPWRENRRQVQLHGPGDGPTRPLRHFTVGGPGPIIGGLVIGQLDSDDQVCLQVPEAREVGRDEAWPCSIELTCLCHHTYVEAILSRRSLGVKVAGVAGVIVGIFSLVVIVPPIFYLINPVLRWLSWPSFHHDETFYDLFCRGEDVFNEPSADGISLYYGIPIIWKDYYLR